MSGLVDLGENAVLNVLVGSKAIVYTFLIFTFSLNAKKSGFLLCTLSALAD